MSVASGLSGTDGTQSVRWVVLVRQWLVYLIMKLINFNLL